MPPNSHPLLRRPFGELGEADKDGDPTGQTPKTKTAGEKKQTKTETQQEKQTKTETQQAKQTKKETQQAKQTKTETQQAYLQHLYLTTTCSTLTAICIIWLTTACLTLSPFAIAVI